MVEAGQRDQLDHLLLRPFHPQGGPERVAHPGLVVEGVHQPDEQALAVRERAGRGLGPAGGGHLLGREADPLGEECHVHTPLVLGAAAGAAGYGLTPLARELIEQFRPLVAWSARWAAALTRGRGTPRSSR
jgi:hypothetical protein